MILGFDSAKMVLQCGGVFLHENKVLISTLLVPDPIPLPDILSHRAAAATKTFTALTSVKKHHLAI